MSRTNGIPYFQEFHCKSCGTWQLKQVNDTRCRFCGDNIPINVEWRDPLTPKGMKKSEDAYARAYAKAEDPFHAAVNTLFCSHCGGIIVAEGKYCGGCGNPKDPSDIKPKAYIGKREIPLDYLLDDQPDFNIHVFSFPDHLTETSRSPVEDTSQEESDQLEAEESTQAAFKYACFWFLRYVSLYFAYLLMLIAILLVVNEVVRR